MPNASDFYNELQGANSRLDGVNSRLDDLKAAVAAVTAAVNQVNNTVTSGFNQVNSALNQLITLAAYANLALYQNDQQNDTIICILEHISKNTCDLDTQSQIQTALQTAIRDKMAILTRLYEATHAADALLLEREAELRRQIEKCCPPQAPPPACTYEPCSRPGRIPEPPSVPQRGNIG
jgi:hypothetical protein